MYQHKFLITYYTLTPLHMGSGSSVSYIDLPIQRERHTSFPMMAGSGIKGVFRNHAGRVWNNKEDVNRIFGPEDGSESSSCVAFTDARILLYPVRSVKNIFAWITCPFILTRFKEDLKSAGLLDSNSDDFTIPDSIDDSKIIVSESTKLKIDSNNNNVGLEEFVFDIAQNTSNIDGVVESIRKRIPEVETKKKFAERFAIVSDNVFTDLVNYAVEVRTRIKIDQLTGTAQGKALFTVEMVPSEAIFYSLLFVNETKGNGNSSQQHNSNSTSKDTDNIENKINELFNVSSGDNGNTKETVLQFGGDETTGSGFVSLRVY